MLSGRTRILPNALYFCLSACTRHRHFTRHKTRQSTLVPGTLFKLSHVPDTIKSELNATLLPTKKTRQTHNRHHIHDDDKIKRNKRQQSTMDDPSSSATAAANTTVVSPPPFPPPATALVTVAVEKS